MAATQVRCWRCLLLAGEPKAIQHLPHTLLGRIAAGVLVAVLQIGVARERRAVQIRPCEHVWITQARGQIGELGSPGV